MTLQLDLRPLVLGGLVAVRILTFILAVPAVGMRSVPGPVKIGLALWLAAAVMPTVHVPAADVPLTPGPLAWSLASEVLVGLLLAFSVVLVFAAAQFAGQVVGMQVGFAIVNAIDPQTQSQVSILSQLYYLLASLLFVAVDGPSLVVAGIAGTFTTLPPGVEGVSAQGAWRLCLGFGELFAAALRLAAPAVVTLLLVSISMGIIGRTVPQLNVLIVGFPLKIAIGLILVGLSLPFFGQTLLHELGVTLDGLADLAASLALGR